MNAIQQTLIEHRASVKALTLWQPWASLMAFGEKRVETRSWATKYRGPVAIHAAKKEPPDWLGKSRHGQEFKLSVEQIAERHQWGIDYWPNQIAVGAVLCIAQLVAVEPVESVRDDLTDQERLFGNYEDGRFAWFFEQIERFERPVPAKGMQGFWTWRGLQRLHINPWQRVIFTSDGTNWRIRQG